MSHIKALIKSIFFRLGWRDENNSSAFLLKFNSGTLAKLFYFKRMLDSVTNIEGDVVECGIGKAVSTQMLVLLINNEGKNRKFWGFDSFEGFPEPTKEDESFRNPKKGEWKKMSQEEVYSILLKCRLEKRFIDSNVNIIKGFFNKTLPVADIPKIALLHLDADLFQSYSDCLKYLFPKVVSGGVVLFDEYDSPKFPGAKKAIDEYFSDKDSRVLKDPISGKYFLIKK